MKFDGGFVLKLDELIFMVLCARNSVEKPGLQGHLMIFVEETVMLRKDSEVPHI